MLIRQIINGIQIMFRWAADVAGSYN